MVGVLASHWVKTAHNLTHTITRTDTHTHTPLLQSWLRALDSCVQSGAKACYLQTGGGQV